MCGSLIRAGGHAGPVAMRQSEQSGNAEGYPQYCFSYSPFPSFFNLWKPALFALSSKFDFDDPTAGADIKRITGVPHEGQVSSLGSAMF